MLISEKAKKAISQKRTPIEAEMMLAFNKSNMTIKRWFAEGNELLTTHKAVQIIKKQTGLTEKQILT